MFASVLLAAALATSAMAGSAPSRAAAELSPPAVVNAVQWGRPAGAARMPAVRARGRGSRTPRRLRSLA
ncbi:MAG: hypothetical protein DMF77_02255 [Acidobacteria bacterium]|nr:MAG: hypothetical protein DMF77_02255 [Acidobacteriota bacterium]